MTNSDVSLKILLVSTAIFPVPPERYSGIESLIYDYARQLNALGHQVTLAAPIGSVPPKGVELIETVNLEHHWDFGPAEEIAYLNYQDRLKDFDVIHDFSHSKRAAMLNPSLPTLNVCWFDPVWFFEANRSAFPMPANNVIALSQYQATNYKRVYGTNPLIQSTNCRAEKYSPSGEWPHDLRFLFIGKMSWHKGAKEAIKFCKHANYGLDVVGGAGVGEPRFYQEDVFKMCDDEQIVWYGEVAEEVKLNLLRRARALLYPCQFPEAHNLVLIEAMMCGTPVITFDRGAMKEVVGDGLGGVAVVDDYFFQNAMTCGNSDSERAKISEWAHAQYSSRNVVANYVGLYRHVAKGAKWR